MRDAVHVVNLRRQEQLADVGKHAIGGDHAGLIGLAVDRCRHAASVEALNDLDQINHLVAQVVRAVEVNAIGFCHQRAGADQQITKARTRRNAGMAMVGCIRVGEVAGVLPFTGEEHAIPGHKHVVEHAHTGTLAEFGAELRCCFTRPARRARDDGEARHIHRHRATHRKLFIQLSHVAARHHQQLVHVRRAGDDGLGAGDHNAIGAALDDMHIAIGIRLRMGPQRTVAFGVGHGDAEGKIVVVNMLDVGRERGVILRARFGITTQSGLVNPGQGIARQITLRTARLLAHQAHGFELVEQVLRALRDRQHAVDAAAIRLGAHHRCHVFVQRQVIGESNGVDARCQRRVVRDRLDPAAIHVDHRFVFAQ